MKKLYDFLTLDKIKIIILSILSILSLYWFVIISTIYSTSVDPIGKDLLTTFTEQIFKFQVDKIILIIFILVCILGIYKIINQKVKVFKTLFKILGIIIVSTLISFGVYFILVSNIVSAQISEIAPSILILSYSKYVPLVFILSLIVLTSFKNNKTNDN